ncbi:MAG: CDP-archaeol synthase [Candidatus Saccharimonadales bacterium]
MIHNLWFGLWYFLPVGVANVSPIFASKIPGLKNLDYPMDFGLKYNGKRVFGNHKTWRGLIFGIIFGIIFIYIQKYLYIHYSVVQSISKPLNYDQSNIWFLGLLLSAGALLADAFESFIKRQKGIDSGETWFPFDQLDYVVGAVVFSLIYIRLGFVQYAWIIAIWFVMHLLFSYLGYVLKMKEKPI